MDEYVKYTVTKEQQLRELTSRIPPILNINVVVWRDGRYLIGRRNEQKTKDDGTWTADKKLHWLFPGGRMQFEETLAEAADRILREELPGVEAQMKKLIATQSDKGYDSRAYGVSLYYLYEYTSGEPVSNYQLDEFKWVTREELLSLDRFYSLNKEIVNEIDVAVRTRNTTQDEVLVEVDKDDHDIGTIVKRVAHADPSRYHRAAHMVMFTTKGELILHQRSWVKATGPGKWDMFGGHQADGMTIEQTAKQELVEELGSSAELHFVQKGILQTKTQSEWYYLYYGMDDGPYGFDRNEVAQIGFFDPQKLLDGGYDAEYDILSHVYAYTEQLKDVWEKLRLS
jgi:ADP-ribose pyrophosphatase YjhB (NUDIX family)